MISFKISGVFAALQSLTASGFVAALVQLMLFIAILLFFFSLLIGGIQFIISGGEKERTGAAKNRIISALIGLVIVFSAWALAGLIGQFFGVNILQLQIPRIQ